MNEEQLIANRATRRRSMRRRGGVVGLSMLATTGLLGAYLGNPRLLRAYAAATNCASGTVGPTVDNEAELTAAIAAFNSQTPPCDTITLGADITLTASPAIMADGKLTLNGGGHFISGNNTPGVEGLRFTSSLPLTVSSLTMKNFKTEAALQASGNVTVTGSTFTDNQAAGMLVYYGSVAITNSTFTRNISNFGAVAVITASSVTVTGSVFDANVNKLDTAGGLSAVMADDVSISNSTFTNNSGIIGGGVVVALGKNSPTITNSYFAGNSSTGGGGAVRGYSSPPVKITGSTFTRNSSISGGALFLESGGTVINSTLSGNTAADVEERVAATAVQAHGGAITNVGPEPLTVSFSTLSGNSSTMPGNAIFAWGPGSVTLTNSIVTAPASNANPDFALPDVSPNAASVTPATFSATFSSLRQGFSFNGDSNPTFATNGASGNQVGVDPQLGTLTDNGGILMAGSTTKHIPTMAPSSGSRVVNAADYTAATDPSTDQRGPGFPRSSGGAADMGAVERLTPTLTYTGARTVTTGGSLRLASTVSPPSCTGSPRYSLNRNPITGASGAYAITGPNASTAKWLAGNYTITATLPAGAACGSATTSAPLKVNKAPVPLTVAAASASSRPARGIPTRLVSAISTPGADTVTVRCVAAGTTTAGDRRWCTWTQDPTTGAITVRTRSGSKVRVSITVVSNPTGTYPSSRYVASTWSRTWTSR